MTRTPHPALTIGPDPATGSAGVMRACGGVLAVLCLAAGPALAGMADALSLCLDSDLSIEARGEAFEAAGWDRTVDTDLADTVLSHGLLISGLDPSATEQWDESRARSAEVAARLRDRRGYDTVQLFMTGTDAVIVEPNRAGRSTCLYVGAVQDLTPVAAEIDPRALRVGETRAEVQGRADGAQIFAFSLTETAMALFTPALEFGSTMTIVLDRRGTE